MEVSFSCITTLASYIIQLQLGADTAICPLCMGVTLSGEAREGRENISPLIGSSLFSDCYLFISYTFLSKQLETK